MKKLNQLFYFIILALFYSCNSKNKTEFYLPAEWEPQSGVIVGGLDDDASFEIPDTEVIPMFKKVKAILNLL